MAVKLHFVLLLVFFSVCIFGQSDKKRGDCPRPQYSGLCSFDCTSDFECGGAMKCCRTKCGGTSCEHPVLGSAPEEKPGFCPRPSGPWVCSNRCGNDKDCRGRKKCCKNRCGAFACQNPSSQYDEIGLFDEN